MKLSAKGHTRLMAGKPPWFQILIGVGIVIVCLAAAYPILLAGISSLMWVSNPINYLKAGPESSGPSAPFADMLALAWRQARKVDPGSALSYFYATSPGEIFGTPYTEPATNSLELNFMFVKPNGSDVWVSFEDASPEATLRVNVQSSESAQKSRYDLVTSDENEREQAYASYELSPRDAVAKTWSQARQNVLKATRFPLGSVDKLQISVWGFYKDASNPGWDVTYSVKERTWALTIGGEVGSWPVDGKTGQVGKPIYATPTPSELPPEPTSTPSTPLATPAAEQIPIYPQAANLEATAGSLRNDERKHLSYGAPISASKDDVLRFYNDTLAKQQWTSNEAASFSQGSSTTRYYNWADRSGSVPYDLWLYVTVSSGPNPRTAQTTVWVDVGLGRSPSASNLPIYPGAGTQAVSEVTDGDVQIRTITYTTAATAPRVEAYYTDVLPQAGWPIQVEADGSIDATWTASNDGQPDGFATYKLRLTFEPGDAMQTKAVIQVSGAPLPGR